MGLGRLILNIIQIIYMNKISTNKKLVNQFKKMTKNSYMDNYGGSVIMTILIAIGVIIVSSITIFKYCRTYKKKLDK